MENLLGKNLKYLRKKRSLNQLQVATVVDKGSTTIGNWENGISEPNISELYKLSQLFGVLTDDIIGRDLTQGNLIDSEKTPNFQQKGNLKGNLNGNLNAVLPSKPVKKSAKDPLLNEPDAPYHKAVMPAVVTTFPDGDENIVYVPVKAQAGYIVGHGDAQYVGQLPTFRMPGLRSGTYRMFEVQGVSMSPTLSDGDRVIGQWVQSLKEIRENRVHIVVLKEGVLIKRVLNRVEERGVIYLKSDTLTHRADHPLREINPSDILEIWYVTMKVSGDLSEPSEIYHRVSDLEIKMHEISKLISQNSLLK